MPSTEEMRRAWSPHCDTSGMETIGFGDQGARITVDRLTVPIWRAVEAIFARHRYKIRKADTGAYNCRRITGGSGYSLHAYGIAVDVNWSTNPYGPNLVTDLPPAAIRAIEALNVEGVPVLRWGGRYSGNKDAMHFEVIVAPAVAARFRHEEDDVTAEDLDKIRGMIQNNAEKVKAAARADIKAEGARTRRAIWKSQGKTAAQIDELEAQLDDG